MGSSSSKPSSAMTVVAEKQEYSEKRAAAAKPAPSLDGVEAFESVDTDILSKWDAENEQVRGWMDGACTAH